MSSYNATRTRWLGFTTIVETTCAPTVERSTSVADCPSIVASDFAVILNRGARRVPPSRAPGAAGAARGGSTAAGGFEATGGFEAASGFGFGFGLALAGAAGRW